MVSSYFSLTSHLTVWVLFSPVFHTDFMASSLNLSISCYLAWAWTQPAGISAFFWRSFLLRTGGQNLISALSISSYPVEQDVLLWSPLVTCPLHTWHVESCAYVDSSENIEQGIFSKLNRFLFIFSACYQAGKLKAVSSALHARALPYLDQQHTLFIKEGLEDREYVWPSLVEFICIWLIGWK